MGNIAHIQAYIDNNAKIAGEEGVIVELYIRPMSKLERETYAVPGLPAGSAKNQGNPRNHKSTATVRPSDKVEKKPGPITRAHLSKWKLNFQEPAHG